MSIFIIIATAAAIGGNGPLSDVGQAAAALRPVAGEAASQWPAAFWVTRTKAKLT